MSLFAEKHQGDIVYELEVFSIGVKEILNLPIGRFPGSKKVYILGDKRYTEEQSAYAEDNDCGKTGHLKPSALLKEVGYPHRRDRKHRTDSNGEERNKYDA